MKNYQLNPPDSGDSVSARRLRTTGKIFFTYDKVFQQKWDKYPKFIKKEMVVPIYENESAEKAISDVKKSFKNARGFKVEMIQPEFPTMRPDPLLTEKSDKILPD